MAGAAAGGRGWGVVCAAVWMSVGLAGAGGCVQGRWGARQLEPGPCGCTGGGAAWLWRQQRSLFSPRGPTLGAPAACAPELGPPGAGAAFCRRPAAGEGNKEAAEEEEDFDDDEDFEDSDDEMLDEYLAGKA